MLRLVSLLLIAASLVFAPIMSAEQTLRSVDSEDAFALDDHPVPQHKNLAQANETSSLPCNHNCNSAGGTIVGIDPAEAPSLRPSMVAAIHYAPWCATFISLVPIPLPDPPKSIG